MDDTQLIAVAQRDGFLPAGKVDAAGRADAIDAVLLDNPIDLFGSRLTVRRKHGDTTRPMHRRRIAIDVDPGRNPLRSNRYRARLATADCVRLRELREDEGWVSLGRMRGVLAGCLFKRWDGMLCRFLVAPGPQQPKGRWMYGMIRRRGYVGWVGCNRAAEGCIRLVRSNSFYVSISLFLGACL